MHIAIIGCGQLARMMALEGWKMGFRFSFLAEIGEGRTCVEGLGPIVERTESLTGEALYTALGSPDVVTVERESVDVSMLEQLAAFCSINPNPKAIRISQHRGLEKGFVNELGVPTAPYRLASTNQALLEAAEHLGLPVIVKTCGEGYDGKGQWKIESLEQLEALRLGDAENSDYIVEKRIAFEKEISIVVARASTGECAFYPITENAHKNGILISSVAPAEAPSHALAVEAKQIATKMLEAMDYVGVLAIEFFVVDGALMVNEFAPRVHNSGHWTQAGGVCSQFENHVRAISGMPLGCTEPLMPVAMVNVLGREVTQDLIDAGNMQLHAYDKSPKAGRKMGHINLWHQDAKALQTQVENLVSKLHG